MKKGLLAKGALLLAFAAALTGCGSQIGPNAKDASLRGETSQTQVFNGGPMGNDTHIQGSALKAGESYDATGRLTIEGSIPDKASITVDGKLIVTGDVGNGVNITVNQPIRTHTEYHTGYCYGYDYSSGKFEYSYKMTPRCSSTVTDGLEYNDSEAAVNIKGHFGTNTDIRTPGPIVVQGHTLSNPNQMAPAPR
jgi:hypothetical protein